MQWITDNKKIFSIVLCVAVLMSVVGFAVVSPRSQPESPVLIEKVGTRQEPVTPQAEPLPRAVGPAPTVTLPTPIPTVAPTLPPQNQTAPAPSPPPAPPVPAPERSDSDYVAPGSYPKTQEQRQKETFDKLRRGEGMSALTTDTTQLEADSNRLRNATTRGDIKEHIRVNQELVRLLQSREQSDSSQRKIARLEAEIQTDLARLSG